MISKRENCRRAIEFTSPERLPVFLGVHLGWLYDRDESKLGQIRDLQSQSKPAHPAGLAKPVVARSHLPQSLTADASVQTSASSHADTPMPDQVPRVDLM
ncbi:MAG: hypothetical protein ACYC27_18995 [Armatimonadota bacterium]